MVNYEYCDNYISQNLPFATKQEVPVDISVKKSGQGKMFVKFQVGRNSAHNKRFRTVNANIDITQDDDYTELQTSQFTKKHSINSTSIPKHC